MELPGHPLQKSSTSYAIAMYNKMFDTMQRNNDFISDYTFLLPENFNTNETIEPKKSWWTIQRPMMFVIELWDHQTIFYISTVRWRVTGLGCNFGEYSTAHIRWRGKQVTAATAPPRRSSVKAVKITLFCRECYW